MVYFLLAVFVLLQSCVHGVVRNNEKKALRAAGRDAVLEAEIITAMAVQNATSTGPSLNVWNEGHGQWVALCAPLPWSLSLSLNITRLDYDDVMPPRH